MTNGSMARAMRTSRNRMDLILRPEYAHVGFDTLAQAATVLDLKVSVELVGVGAAGEKSRPRRSPSGT